MAVESIVGGSASEDPMPDLPKVLPDPTARVNALASGQVDCVTLDARTVEQAEAAGKEMATGLPA